VTFTTATVAGTVAVTGTAGQFSCVSCTGLAAGMTFTISGTWGTTTPPTGYSSPTSYYISVTNGTTTFTLKTLAQAAIVTTVGTPTGLTYAAGGGFLRSTGFSVGPTGAVTGQQFNIAGNLSVASGVVNGMGMLTSSPVYTDSSMTGGTIANAFIYSFPQPNLETTTTTTYSNVSTLYLPGPTCSAGGGATPTCSNLWSLTAAGPVRFSGQVTATSGSNFFGGANSFSGGAASINANSNFTTDIGDGSTTSQVTIGGGSNGVIVNSNSAGYLKDTGLISTGTKFTTSGCSVSSTTGGATAGTFTLGANTCTVIITMNGATGLTAPNGWFCTAHDRTTIADLVNGETSSTATTASIVIPVTVGSTDVISFSCTGY
jgi:hypothetical protein